MTVIRVFQTIKQWTKWYRIRSVRQWKGKKNWQRKEIVIHVILPYNQFCTFKLKYFFNFINIMNPTTYTRSLSLATMFASVCSSWGRKPISTFYIVTSSWQSRNHMSGINCGAKALLHLLVQSLSWELLVREYPVSLCYRLYHGNKK